MADDPSQPEPDVQLSEDPSNVDPSQPTEQETIAAGERVQTRVRGLRDDRRVTFRAEGSALDEPIEKELNAGDRFAPKTDQAGTLRVTVGGTTREVEVKDPADVDDTNAPGQQNVSAKSERGPSAVEQREDARAEARRREVRERVASGDDPDDLSDRGQRQVRAITRDEPGGGTVLTTGEDAPGPAVRRVPADDPPDALDPSETGAGVKTRLVGPEGPGESEVLKTRPAGTDDVERLPGQVGEAARNLEDEVISKTPIPEGREDLVTVSREGDRLIAEVEPQAERAINEALANEPAGEDLARDVLGREGLREVEERKQRRTTYDTNVSDQLTDTRGLLAEEEGIDEGGFLSEDDLATASEVVGRQTATSGNATVDAARDLGLPTAGARTAGNIAGGAAQGIGQAPFELARIADVGSEVAVQLPGTIRDQGADDVAGTAALVGEEQASRTLDYALDNPARFGGELYGGAALGSTVGRAAVKRIDAPPAPDSRIPNEFDPRVGVGGTIARRARAEARAFRRFRSDDRGQIDPTDELDLDRSRSRDTQPPRESSSQTSLDESTAVELDEGDVEMPNAFDDADTSATPDLDEVEARADRVEVRGDTATGLAAPPAAVSAPRDVVDDQVQPDVELERERLDTATDLGLGLGFAATAVDARATTDADLEATREVDVTVGTLDTRGDVRVAEAEIDRLDTRQDTRIDTRQDLRLDLDTRQRELQKQDTDIPTDTGGGDEFGLRRETETDTPIRPKPEENLLLRGRRPSEEPVRFRNPIAGPGGFLF